MALVTLLSLNKSTYKDDEYYAQIKPETVKLLAQALEANQLKLTKDGNISIQGYKNTPQGGGTPYLSVKFTREENSVEKDEPKESNINLEDIPF
jgi:hypothetical protein